MVAFGGGESMISIYRMDTLHLSGPTTRMLRQTRGDALHEEIRRYAEQLGPVLIDGSLVEWLISSGRDDELQTLLSVRPSASLFLLPRDPKNPKIPRKTPFELAILTRRDKALSFLLAAAARFAQHGEPIMDKSNTASSAMRRRRTILARKVNAKPLPGGGTGDQEKAAKLLPPALRYVTSCMKDALR